MSKKILAVDLGITSFGYTVVTEFEPNRYSCFDYGVIMRDAPFEKDGKSKQMSRREQASQRKLNEKKKKRIRELAKLFERFGLLSFNACMQVQKKNKIVNKWQLRAEDALNRPLTPYELFAILAHMAKHRGYKSIAMEDLLYELELELGLIEPPEFDGKKETDERRQVYAALNRVEELKQLYSHETIAQVIHRAVQEGKLRSYRNHDNYEKMIRREDIEKEIETILAKQCEMGGIAFDTDRCKAFIESVQEIITDQTMPENDPDLFGKCSYYPQEIAAPKYSYLYDLYRLYKVLADLNISNYEVTQEDREKIVFYVTNKIEQGKSVKQLTYKEIRKILSLSPDQKLYGKEDQMVIKGKASQRTLIKYFFISELSKFPLLMQEIKRHPDHLKIFVKLAEHLRFHKTPKPALEAIRELCTKHGINLKEEEILALIKAKNAGTLSISHKFIIDALPHFAEGKNETETKEILGVATSEDYSTFPKSLRHLHLGTNNLYEQHKNSINNHAVKSLASWALRRISDLSWRYGTFDEIIIESARDALPQSIKDAIDKAMREREKEIDKIIAKYQKEFPKVDRKMARKIKLLEAQNFMDLYIGKIISLSDLFEGRVDIEHIVPRSLGGTNAEYNIVIAHRDANIQKGNRLPMDWLTGDKEYFNRVEKLFQEHKISWKKRKNLLAKSLDETYVEVPHTKSMRATSYLEALVTEVLKMFYPFKDEKVRKYGHGVRNVPGKTTSRTRALLNVKSKSRDTNFHHAEDVLILSTISKEWQNRLHRKLKENYRKSEEELQKIWEEYTPHIEGITLDEYVKEAFERFMSMSENSLFYRDMNGEKRTVSYWVNKKPLSASSHKDTVYSMKHYDPNSGKPVPTIRKSILGAFRDMKIFENRNKWTLEEFDKQFDKEIRQKLWLHRIGNYNDPVYRAVELRAEEIKALISEYLYKDAAADKEADEMYKEKLSVLLNEPIIAAKKPVYKVHFVDETFNPIAIERGKKNEVFVRTDDNFLAVQFSKGDKGKLQIEKVDVNSRNKLQTKDTLIVYPNEMIYLFNKKKIIHYGDLRSLIMKSSGTRLIKLFNSKYPSSPAKQPKQFSSGSKIKEVSIGSTTGVIKVHLDFTGRIKSYEKFGFIPEELEAIFLKESGYGSMENGTDHQTL